MSILCGLLSSDYAENVDVSIFMKFCMVLDLVYPKIFTREITVYHGDTSQHKTCYMLTQVSINICYMLPTQR